MAARGGRAPSGADPLSGVELVLVDGNNLIGDRRLPPGAVIGPIRAAIPPGVRVELLFDGPPRGGVTGRLATGFTVRYSGRLPADDLILDVVGRQAAEHGPAATWSILVVTDDRQLRDAARMRGARTAGVAWLTARAGAIAAGADAGGRGSVGPLGGRGGGPRAGAPRGATGGGATSVGSGGLTRRARAGTSLGHGRPPRRPDSDA